MIQELTFLEVSTEALPQDDYMNVVMFFGEGCGPCKATMPHYEEAVAYFEAVGTRIRFYKYNTWESAESIQYCSERWGINGVPHFKILFRGNEILSKIGGGDSPEMKDMIIRGIGEVFTQYGEVL